MSRTPRPRLVPLDEPTPERRTTFPGLPNDAAVLSVGELNERIKQLLEDGFAGVWVEGELANVVRAGSGHLYFSLRQGETAKISAAMWKTQTLRLPRGFTPRDGVEVIAFGTVSLFSPRGDYQLIVQRLIPKGIGAAELALRELKEKLQAKGYFDPRRKRLLPKFPRTICLITSATGAAVRDMIEILDQRWPLTKVVVRPSRVQGEGAAEEMAAAIVQVNHWRARRQVQVDVIVIGRGGGSAEDLSPFDRESLADAIFQSAIPIVSAVGHEVDMTIADSVADARASTPSHAAEMLVPDRMDIDQRLREMDYRLSDSIRRELAERKERLEYLARRRVLTEPLARLRELQQLLDDRTARLRRAVESRMRKANSEVELAAAQIEALSPLKVLGRGYSLTRLVDSPELLRTSTNASIGTRIETVLERGKIISVVESAQAPLQASSERRST